MRDSKTIKPCPFCNTNAAGVYLSTSNSGNRFVAIRCSKCRSRGPEFIAPYGSNEDIDQLKAQAIDAWNQRSDDSEMSVAAQFSFNISSPSMIKKVKDLITELQTADDDSPDSKDSKGHGAMPLDNKDHPNVYLSDWRSTNVLEAANARKENDEEQKNP